MSNSPCLLDSSQLIRYLIMLRILIFVITNKAQVNYVVQQFMFVNNPISDISYEIENSVQLSLVRLSRIHIEVFVKIICLVLPHSHTNYIVAMSQRTKFCKYNSFTADLVHNVQLFALTIRTDLLDIDYIYIILKLLYAEFCQDNFMSLSQSV